MTARVKAVTSEVAVEAVTPMFSLRRLAEFFDVTTEDGRPCTETIREWWHSGRLPPPDLRMSRKAIYWLPETIERHVRGGGVTR